jgi:hypothetical protein
MQFLAFCRPVEISDAPPSPEHMDQMNRLIEAMLQMKKLDIATLKQAAEG